MILVFGYDIYGCARVWACEAIIWRGQHFWFDTNDSATVGIASTTGGPSRKMHVGICWPGSGAADTMDIEDLGHGVGQITLV